MFKYFFSIHDSHSRSLKTDQHLYCHTMAHDCNCCDNATPHYYHTNAHTTQLCHSLEVMYCNTFKKEKGLSSSFRCNIATVPETCTKSPAIVRVATQFLQCFVYFHIAYICEVLQQHNRAVKRLLSQFYLPAGRLTEYTASKIQHRRIRDLQQPGKFEQPLTICGSIFGLPLEELTGTDQGGL